MIGSLIVGWCHLQRWKATMIEWLHDMIQARMMKCQNLRCDPRTTIMKQVPQYLLIGDSSLYCKGRWENVERYFVWLGVKDVMTVLTHWIFSVPWPFDMFCVEPVEWDAFPKWRCSQDPRHFHGMKDLSWLNTAVSLDSPGETSKTSSTRQDLASENRILREKLEKTERSTTIYLIEFICTVPSLPSLKPTWDEGGPSPPFIFVSSCLCQE